MKTRERHTRFRILPRAILSFALLLSLLTGCADDSGDNPAETTTGGNLFVKVVDENDLPTPGVIVFSQPFIGKDTTDATGTVFMQHIPAGIYIIKASKADYGSGLMAVKINEGEVINIDIKLEAGVFLEPVVSIISPPRGEEFSYRDTIRIEAMVIDIGDEIDSLSLVWWSSIDDTLHGPVIYGDSTVSFTPDGLNFGHHLVYLFVTDRDDLVGRDSVLLTLRKFIPTIEIITPESGAEYVPGDTIEFEVVAGDRETPLPSLEGTWSSDLDGELGVLSPDSSGRCRFTTGSLSKGDHWIYAQVRDEDGFSVVDSVLIINNLPPAVTLGPPVKTFNSIYLTWSADTSSDFACYHVYAGANMEIATFTNREATSFNHYDINYKTTYYYYVVVENDAGRVKASNIESVEAGIYIDLEGPADKMIGDPKRPCIYTIDRVTNSLRIVNTMTRQLEMVCTIGSNPTDLDIDASGDTLWVATYGATELAAFDLESRTLARVLPVPTYPYKLECARQGRLVYCDEDQWCDLNLVDAATGQILSHKWGISEPDIEMSPSGSSIYTGESQISSGHASRWGIIGDSLVTMDGSEGYSYPSRLIVLSGDGRYIFYRGMMLSAYDLKDVLGETEVVYASNYDGSIVFSQNNIYSTRTFTALRGMPLKSGVLTVPMANSMLYIYDDSTYRIYIYDFRYLSSNQEN